jgi:hypothetical protein
MYSVSAPAHASHRRIAWPMNSGPLSLRMCWGTPRRANNSANTSITSIAGIRFATSRGPMNIATYLLGHTETLIGVKTNPEEIHDLPRIVTEFIVDWLRYQAASFPSIDAVLVLDDLIGFLGKRILSGSPYLIFSGSAIRLTSG